MNIAIMIPSLNTGGAERTAVALANWLANNTKENIYLINLGKNDNNYFIDKKVIFITKSKTDSRLKNYFKVMKILRKKKINLIFEMLFTPLRCAIPYKLFNRRVVIIGSERANPKQYAKLRGAIRSRFCPYLCDGYIFQTEVVKNMFTQKIIKKSIVIPNAVSNPEVKKITRKENFDKVVVAVGRLCRIKGFDYLIKSFNKVSTLYPEYKLYIYGSGELKSELKNLISSLKLNSKVFIFDAIPNVMSEVSKNDIFVLSSLSEGMPNALMEAMAIGMPCIASNCIAGPSELIKNNYNGILVEPGNVEELEKAIIELIRNEKLKNKIASNAVNILKTHSPDNIFQKYYDYFQKIYNEKNKITNKNLKKVK